MSAPVYFTWDGESMAPMPRFAKLCDKQYVVGETYCLVPHEDRSANSHRHYFASLRNAWLNIPEDLTERFPTSEHLRKFALIKAGYADQRQFVCGSKAEALRLSTFLSPMDSYAVVTVQNAVVNVFTAQSQSTKAMGRKEFAESKNRVLDIVAGLIEVAPQTLSAEAGRAA